MTNETTSQEPHESLAPSLLGWAIAYATVAVAVMVGNFLTIAAFCTNNKLTHMRTNYFLVSLGVADFLVGACSIPMYVTEMLFSYFEKEESRVKFHEIYLPVDAFTGLASIFALVAIAIDRAYSVFCPHHHKTTTKRTYLNAIASVWLLAGCVAGVRVLGNFTNKKLLMSVFSYVVMVTIFASLIIISVAYSLIWRKVRTPFHADHHRNATPQERKLAITLSIITIVFVLTWLPFYIMNIVIMYCNLCYILELVYFGKLLHYSNSFANFIIYVLKITEFRKTVVKLVCKKRRISMDPRKREQNSTAHEAVAIHDIRIKQLRVTEKH